MIPMAKEFFKEHQFKGESAARLQQIIDVVEKFDEMGYKLTLRQLYYQLVSANLIPNNDKEYGKLSEQLTHARLAGLVDWDIIEDHGRQPQIHPEWETLGGLVDSAAASFRLPRWADQKYYVELWTEKDALSTVLLPITNKYHINLVVNRGFSSTSAMYHASKRIIEAESNDKIPVILYLGDHDPSGLDMDRDIRDRLKIFGFDIKPLRIGLIMAQIQKFNPPPNPAKLSDSRAAKYVEQYGESSWEVDAIPPQELSKIVELAIQEFVDVDKYNTVIGREEVIKQRFKQATDKIRGLARK